TCDRAALDDIDDIVNGNRRLGDVGGDDDLGHALWWAVKHRLLFLIGQRGVERGHCTPATHVYYTHTHTHNKHTHTYTRNMHTDTHKHTHTHTQNIHTDTPTHTHTNTHTHTHTHTKHSLR